MICQGVVVRDSDKRLIGNRSARSESLGGECRTGSFYSQVRDRRLLQSHVEHNILWRIELGLAGCADTHHPLNPEHVISKSRQKLDVGPSFDVCDVGEKLADSGQVRANFIPLVRPRNLVWKHDRDIAVVP